MTRRRSISLVVVVLVVTRNDLNAGVTVGGT